MIPLFVDLDGVLVDFIGGFAKVMHAHGHGKEFCQNFWNSNTEECKKMICNTPQFWLNLEWTADGKELWDHIKKHRPSIISAPIFEDDNCVPEKMAWITNNLQEAGDVYLVRRSFKILHSFNPKTEAPNLLIDDYEKTVLEWRATGAPGIHHKSAAETILSLREHGY